MNELIADVQNSLETLFSDVIQSIHPCWELSDWSRVYRLELRDGTRLFLKGTPRSRNEALVMQCLHDVCATCVPHVLITDLVPSAPWCWFLMEDVGCCELSALSRSVAIEAAKILGLLQQRALHDQVLPSLLIRCEGSTFNSRRLMSVGGQCVSKDAKQMMSCNISHWSSNRLIPSLRHWPNSFRSFLRPDLAPV